MLYNNKEFNFNLIKFYKPYINNKFFFLRFFFLTNFFFYSPFSSIFLFSEKNSLSNIFIKIKKNLKFYYKIYNHFKKFLYFKKFNLNTTFKFNTFFKTLYKINFLKKINKSRPLLTFNNFFLRNYKKIFYKNWYFLTGTSISPFSWDLYSKKKWIRRDLNFFIIKNLFYFNKKNKIKFKNMNNLFFKKILLNNFFYLKKNNINLNKINFLLKIKINNNFKNNYNWFLSRPYLFLNNYEHYRFNTFFNNFLLINLYKNYSKFFYNLKKFNYSLRLKNTNDVFFKKFLTKYKLIKKFSHNNVYLPFIPLTNHFSFFNFKNFLLTTNNENLLRKKNKNYKYFKLISKSFFVTKFIPKTKIYKKNKINSNTFFNTKNNIFKKSILINFKLIKLSKRIKKLNFLYLLNNLKKNFWINKFNPICLWNKFYFNNKNNNYIIIFNKYNFINNLNFKPFSAFLLQIIINYKKINIFKKIKSSFILSNFKKPIFFSKEKNFFVLNKYSFLFLNDFFLNYKKNINFLYNLKKIMYSFSYKNEIQKFILKRYNRINFTNNFYNSNMNNIYININNNFKIENSFSNDFNTLTDFFKKKSEIFFFMNQNIFNSNNWTYFNENFTFNKNLLSEDTNFNIKRVRFKPGYMSLWREVRSVFKISLNLKFKYQYKLTNYLSKYNKFIKFKTFLLSEMRLFNILLRTRLLNDNNLCLLFIKNNLIYLNGYLCTNYNFQLFVGDFLQLIITFKYYILYKWFLNLSLKKKNRLKNVSKKKMHFSIDSDEKKRSNTLPKWILFSKNSFNDVAKYMEVDYFTLSSIILYEPFNWSDINSYNLIDQRFGIINLYNWKYIT